jgi:hypothetical protein
MMLAQDHNDVIPLLANVTLLHEVVDQALEALRGV